MKRASPLSLSKIYSNIRTPKGTFLYENKLRSKHRSPKAHRSPGTRRHSAQKRNFYKLNAPYRSRTRK